MFEDYYSDYELVLWMVWCGYLCKDAYIKDWVACDKDGDE